MSVPRDPVAPSASDSWPPLPWAEWQDTCDTLHLWMQVVGKVKLALTPFLNHYWHVGFHLTARGLTTGLIPHAEGAFEVRFDFLAHELIVEDTSGRMSRLPLRPRAVADFYDEFLAALRAHGVAAQINPLPTEIPDAIPLDRDRTHAAYDPAAVRCWWQVQVETAKVLQRYRATFAGKSSPILFYWGSFDLNVARYSGRPATPPPGVPRFFALAENWENVACGFWPGNPTLAASSFREPAFYAYAYPAPAGFADAPVRPSGAYYHPELGEFILPYEAARQAASPDQSVLDFFQSVYEAGATLGGWDRALLEFDPEA